MHANLATKHEQESTAARSTTHCRDRIACCILECFPAVFSTLLPLSTRINRNTLGMVPGHSSSEQDLIPLSSLNPLRCTIGMVIAHSSQHSLPPRIIGPTAAHWNGSISKRDKNTHEIHVQPPFPNIYQNRAMPQKKPQCGTTNVQHGCKSFVE